MMRMMKLILMITVMVIGDGDGDGDDDSDGDVSIAVWPTMPALPHLCRYDSGRSRRINMKMVICIS